MKKAADSRRSENTRRTEEEFFDLEAKKMEIYALRVDLRERTAEVENKQLDLDNELRRIQFLEKLLDEKKKSMREAVKSRAPEDEKAAAEERFDLNVKKWEIWKLRVDLKEGTSEVENEQLDLENQRRRIHFLEKQLDDKNTTSMNEAGTSRQDDVEKRGRE